MNNIDDFYNSILNIRLQQNEKTKELIQRITKNAVEEVKKVTPDLDGFCKFLASEIQGKLDQNGIRNYWIDLNELINVDHVVLIAEYRTAIGMQRLLIDPSFQQFTKQENKKLIKLNDWPSEKIEDKNMVTDLLETGITELDEKRWTDYLQGFTENSQNITLDNLLKGKLKGRNKEMIEKENKIIYEMNGEEIGVVKYEKIDENTIDIYHTYVAPDYQGRHIAGDLMEYLFKKLQKEKIKATASCSYAKHWMEKHPEYNDNFI